MLLKKRSIKPKIENFLLQQWKKLALKCLWLNWHTTLKSVGKFNSWLAIHASLDPTLLWVVLAEELPITVMSLKRFVIEAWIYHQLQSFTSISTLQAGKSMKWKLSETKPITASLFVPLKISIPWEFTLGIRLL